jgi:hypothetical protein
MNGCRRCRRTLSRLFPYFRGTNAPSDSTIGDWFPERNVFQILIALTAAPRLAMVLASYLVRRRSGSFIPGFLASCTLVRTIAAGGWIYITSSDHGDVHDFFMILCVVCRYRSSFRSMMTVRERYMVMNIPHMLGTIHYSTNSSSSRKAVAAAFFGALPPLIYFYIQHKVHRVAGGVSFGAVFVDQH